ncbi:methyltransferase domain-containing protein [Candidatus Woesearchaeota archaeon]|nr:methyltransferase domain-containing protein [Candidatus Woesearchaeota archaeon]
MKLKDYEMLWKSLIHSSSDIGITDWWNKDKDIDKMISHLSDKDTPERMKIREIIRENNISTILDAACGPATEYASYLSENLDINYTGLDRSDYMLKVAKQRYADINFVKGNVEILPFEDNQFQAVLLKHILEHLPTYENAVSESVRVASELVIIHFFHATLPLIEFDLNLKHKAGFWESWYSRKKFEKFLGSLPITHYERINIEGTSRQTAHIYLLKFS